jgi:hypothetical protein
MHQNTFLTTPDVEKYLFLRVVWKHAQMQNTFLTTPDTKKYLFQGHVSGGMEPLHTLKNIFVKAMFLVHAKMHQNTLSTTPDV